MDVKKKDRLPLPRLDALPLEAHRLSLPECAPTSPDAIMTDEGLFEATGVRIAFAGREGGVGKGPCASLNCMYGLGDAADTVLRNQALLLEYVGVPDARVLMPKQVHGTHVVSVGPDDVDAAAQEIAQGADGLVVQAPRVAALLNFADCLPVIMVAPNGDFAVAHAGWRGAVGHIARISAQTLAQRSGCSPSAFNAYIGPHIRVECFEVGDEVADRFEEELGGEVVARPGGRSALADGKSHVSLARAVTLDLLSAGIPAERVADVGICTKCNPDRYFSYRASGGVCGRNATLAVRIAK